MIEKTFVRYEFKNESGETLFFEQRALTRSDYYIDSESGYSEIEEIEKFEIYYRLVDNFHCYVWSNESYSVKMKTSVKLSNEEIIMILYGITTK